MPSAASPSPPNAALPTSLNAVLASRLVPSTSFLPAALATNPVASKAFPPIYLMGFPIRNLLTGLFITLYPAYIARPAGPRCFSTECTLPPL